MYKEINSTYPENIVPFLMSQEKQFTVMAVEDDRLQRAFLEERVLALGHKIIESDNGEDALRILRERPNDIDIVLMDRIMPVMDGLTAVRRMKDSPELRKIPVIMVTGASSPQEMQEGLEAGVFYYLAKPVDPNILASVLSAAVREVEQVRALTNELRRHKASFNLLETCKFKLKTLDEAECLSAFVAHCFPDPERVVQGLAELIVNAVEHGNLDIGYSRKSELIEDGTWRAEIDRRLTLPEFCDRYVEVSIARRQDGVYAIVTDQGAGFNWQKFMTIDPSRASDNHGRGIAQANALSFDRLTYNSEGNQAVAYVGWETSLEW